MAVSDVFLVKAAAVAVGKIAVSAVTKVLAKDVAEVALKESGEATGEVLTRYATGKESVGRLTRQAELSLNNPLEKVHGVSTTAGAPTREGYKQLPRSVVESRFPVHNTPMPNDPLHRTVELPRPVTREVADKWNELWGFER